VISKLSPCLSVQGTKHLLSSNNHVKPVEKRLSIIFRLAMKWKRCSSRWLNCSFTN